jgi:hypothetical protein
LRAGVMGPSACWFIRSAVGPCQLAGPRLGVSGFDAAAPMLVEQAQTARARVATPRTVEPGKMGRRPIK